VTATKHQFTNALPVKLKNTDNTRLGIESVSAECESDALRLSQPDSYDMIYLSTNSQWNSGSLKKKIALLNLIWIPF
jgi:hypothetical protein